MARLRLSAAARRDLAEVRRYGIREFGGDAADSYFRGFKKSFALLRERPFAGASEPDLRDAIRSLTYKRHRIFYRVEDDVIEVLRVLHHARDASGILDS